MATKKATKKGAKKKAAKKKAAKKKLGRNVTFRFPGAKEQDFLVFADGGAFYVTDKDAPDKALHPKPLHKNEVEPFMKEYLAT